MKRDFLQGLKVGDLPLSKEVVDAIMAEHGRDIENIKTRYADYETMKEQLAQAERLQTEAEAAKQWEQMYNDAVSKHRQELADLTFDHNLEKAILAAKGRNCRAIAALLDMESLKSCENQNAAMEEALQNLKNECGYLFQEQLPPPFARGTGAQASEENRSPATLAGALLEKFERK